LPGARRRDGLRRLIESVRQADLPACANAPAMSAEALAEAERSASTSIRRLPQLEES
jgi:hypothetical protein